MEEQKQKGINEIESEQEGKSEEVQQQQKAKEENLLLFLDSLDGYLTLLDSLSSTLREGWLELAGARHSMGASRISSVLLDLKVHSADTSVQVSQYDGDFYAFFPFLKVLAHLFNCLSCGRIWIVENQKPHKVWNSRDILYIVVDSMEAQPTFVLHKWVSSDNGEHSFGEAKPRDNKLQMVFDGLQLRNRSGYQLPEGKASAAHGNPLTLNDEVQKKRSKSLSVFGGLVSPRLRASQLSFETALETLVYIANLRSTILSTFNQVQKDLEDTKG